MESEINMYIKSKVILDTKSRITNTITIISTFGIIHIRLALKVLSFFTSTRFSRSMSY